MSKDDTSKKRKWDAKDASQRPKRARSAKAETEANAAVPPENKLLEAEVADIHEEKLLSVSDGQNALLRQTTAATGWRISKPMGGRMMDIDPILTDDERHLILAYNTSIQVYSATDSLLIRRIPVSTLDASSTSSTKSATIVAMRSSRQNPKYLWVACSDGRIFHINWTQTRDAQVSFQTKSNTAYALAVGALHCPKQGGEVLYVAESDKPGRLDVIAYQPQQDGEPFSKLLLNLKKQGEGLRLLETGEDGVHVVGALNDRLFLGTTVGTADTLEQLQYKFYSFDAPDLLTAIDVRSIPRPTLLGKKKAPKETLPVIDIIAGGARGQIYRYHDAFALLGALEKEGGKKEVIQAQSYHWHRKAVHSLKWSRDGHYMISGGSENVLVLWQMDTSKKDFLPHLSGCIENITVSKKGSSYVLHLDDNSTMILSTSELKPTAYVSGIQSAVVSATTPKDMLVKRVSSAPGEIQQTIPTAMRPTESTKMYVCVGNGRQATLTGGFSIPLLQSFDLEAFASTSRQALARTQPTDVNTNKGGFPIDEPQVTYIAFSADGKWLASLDEWSPAPRDVEYVSGDLKNRFLQERRETHLKFWEMQDGDEPAALVSRINGPHATGTDQVVLDLASSPSAQCFATIGSDGFVRLWKPKKHQQSTTPRGPAAAANNAFSWACSHIIPVGGGNIEQSGVEVMGPAAGDEQEVADQPLYAQGKVVFSEDGSTIFAAFGLAGDSGAVVVIDAAAGVVVQTIEGLWSGKLRAVKTLASCLIVLSDDIRVYDVVSDELRYGIVLPKLGGPKELVQLAVDSSSGHFAVSLPTDDHSSSVGVFDSEDSEPLFVRNIPHRVLSLVSSPDASGFIALDDAAQIWVLAEGSRFAVLATAQPLQDLRLDDINVDSTADEEALEAADKDEDEDEDDEDMLGVGEPQSGELENEGEDTNMEDDFYPAVVPQQHLAQIFDAAPAFAALSVEDMFYKVTSLLATKPLSAS